MVKGSRTGLALIVVALIATVIHFAWPQKVTPLEERAYTIAILPEENSKTLHHRYDPLVAYLSESLGVPFQLLIPDNYDQLLKLFHAGEIDLAFFGGFTFLKANRDSGAVPVVMRDTDLRFRSHFIARKQASHRHLKDFKGKKLAFGSALSTSGHLMPRFFLEDQEISPESFFASVEYSGAHDETALRVQNASVDLGAINAEILDDMFSDGRLDRDAVEIIWTTPKYPDYVWAVKKTISPEFQHKLLSAFLQLDPQNEHHAVILERAQAGGFLPARQQDFDQLLKIATNLGML